ncbi:hypothetical protein [Mesorhizobium sp.]|uniref:hypothetical protein n=1 Tax=Mesorhizobium sp. TaxID=1871066 RepID=UPI000FE871F7|nr:hypothetical protein [Mesorhizobium sp.]RWF66873.1 MAG: hypothetical protein EOS47_04625 [Mesorhizobium sp.]
MSLLAPADFAERLVPRRAEQVDELSPTAALLVPEGAAPAAEASTLRASAAFCHFTESSDGAPCASEVRAGLDVATRLDRVAPAEGETSAGAVVLSNASRFILRLIAAHDGRPEADVLARLIVAQAQAIGLSPLLTGAAEDIGDDFGDLPDFARSAQSRFCGAREADRNLRGLRR